MTTCAAGAALNPAAQFKRLVNELVEAADERQLSDTIARYGHSDLLCLDELGYMESDRRGAELLFQVLTEREETISIATASNESFGGWTRTFTDPRLCAAIVDRLTFKGNIGTVIPPGARSGAVSGTVKHPWESVGRLRFEPYRRRQWANAHDPARAARSARAARLPAALAGSHGLAGR